MAGFDVTAKFQLVDAFSAQAAKISASADAVKAKMAGLGNTAGKMGDGFGKFTGGMNGFIGSMRMMAGAAVLGGLTKIVTAAAEFESKMADIYKVAPGLQLTIDQMKKLKDITLEIAREIPVATSELQEIIATGFQQGVSEEDIKAFTLLSSQMKVAFDMTAEDVGRSMGKIKYQYQLSIDQMREFGNVANALGNSMPAREKEIINFMTRASGLTTILGISVPNLQAVGAALISVGTPAEVAARAMNNFGTAMSTLKSKGKGVKEINQALKILGTTAADLKKSMLEDASGAMLEVFKRLKNVSKEQRGFVTKALFGQNFSDDFSKLVKVPEVLEQALSTVHDSQQTNNSLAKEFERRSNTTLAKWQKMKNTLTELGVVLGDVLLPPLNAILSLTNAIVGGFNGLISKLNSGLGKIFSKENFQRAFSKGEDPNEIGKTYGAEYSMGAETYEDRMALANKLNSPAQAPSGKVDVNVKVTAADGAKAAATVTTTGKGLSVGGTTAGRYTMSDYGY